MKTASKADLAALVREMVGEVVEEAKKSLELRLGVLEMESKAEVQALRQEFEQFRAISASVDDAIALDQRLCARLDALESHAREMDGVNARREQETGRNGALLADLQERSAMQETELAKGVSEHAKAVGKLSKAVDAITSRLTQIEASHQAIVKRQSELEGISIANHSEAIEELARTLTTALATTAAQK